MNKYKGREDWYAAYYKRNKEKYQHTWMSQEIEEMLKALGMGHKDIIALDIPDKYEYRNPELMQLIREKYDG